MSLEPEQDRERWELENSRLIVVAATLGLNLLALIGFSFIPSSNWETGLFLALADNLILVLYAFSKQDRLMGHLIVFGLAAGITELFADAYLAGQTKSLDYASANGPMIYRSLIWMPLAWEIAAVQIGYLGMRIIEAWEWLGTLTMALLGGAYQFFWLETGSRAHWWIYRNPGMIMHVPYFMILGGVGIAVIIPLFARTQRGEKISLSVVGGFLAGAAIYACYWSAYAIIG